MNRRQPKARTPNTFRLPNSRLSASHRARQHRWARFVFRHGGSACQLHIVYDSAPWGALSATLMARQDRRPFHQEGLRVGEPKRRRPLGQEGAATVARELHFAGVLFTARGRFRPGRYYLSRSVAPTPSRATAFPAHRASRDRHDRRPAGSWQQPGTPASCQESTVSHRGTAPGWLFRRDVMSNHAPF